MPSRAVLFSGKYGIRNGAVANGGREAGLNYRLPANAFGDNLAHAECLPRQLRKAGYHTVSFSNFADRHGANWFQGGWSEFHTPNLKCGRETADEVNGPLLHWLKSNATRENLFLHVNYWDIHRPYRHDPSYLEHFRDTPVLDWPDEATIASHQNLTGRFTPHEWRASSRWLCLVYTLRTTGMSNTGRLCPHWPGTNYRAPRPTQASPCRATPDAHPQSTPGRPAGLPGRHGTHPAQVNHATRRTTEIRSRPMFPWNAEEEATG